MSHETGSRGHAEVGEIGKPKVHIVVGADNNTLQINGATVLLSRQKRDYRYSKRHSDAIALLEFLQKQENQKRWVASAELASALREELSTSEHEIELNRPGYLSSRVYAARDLLVSRLKVQGVPLFSPHIGHGGSPDIGIMKFDLSVEREPADKR